MPTATTGSFKVIEPGKLLLRILPTCSNRIFRALVVWELLLGRSSAYTSSIRDLLDVRKLSCCPRVCLQQESGIFIKLYLEVGELV